MASSSRHADAPSSSQDGPAGMKYDPHQDIEEKREIRKQYRTLLAEADSARANLAENKAKDLSHMVRQGDELYTRVKAPNEGVLDARLLLNLSDMGAQMARSMKVATGAFDIDEYLTRITAFVGGEARARRSRAGSRRRRGADDADDEDEMADMMGPERWDWDRLGRAAARHTRRVPAMDCLLGPLEVTHKQRANVKRARVEVEGPKTRPQELQEEDIVRSENETTRLVKQMADRLLYKGGEDGVNIFRFLVDPSSFPNTVENFFYASFLVREGRMSLSEESGEPRLLLVDPPTEEDYRQGLRRQQLVFELDIAMWKDVIEVYDIKESMLPSREPPQGAGAARKGAWYG